MARKHTLNRGKEAFLEYYSQLLPQFSDPVELEKYLSAKNPPVLMFSPMHEEDLQKRWQQEKLTWQPLDWYPFALAWPPEVPVGTPLPGYKEGWLYSLNAASLLPVVVLNPQNGDSILDACASPGGKTLAIANLVDTAKTLIVANDASAQRARSAKAVLRMYGYDQIPVYHHPAQNLASIIPDQFDKILIDAPCSSEKHVFNSKSHLRIWSPSRISKLSQLQQEIVTSLIPLLKPGGTMVYSTCALAPDENEEVASKISQKHPELAVVSMSRINDPESSFDPMFVAQLRKRTT
jgi:16S rRNA C967 or C1407 C5-methylase (RsmB/RsmF family)